MCWRGRGHRVGEGSGLSALVTRILEVVGVLRRQRGQGDLVPLDSGEAMWVHGAAPRILI